MVPSRIAERFESHLALVDRSRRRLAEGLGRAARMLIESLLAGGKILLCGNGGSAADAQHFATELVVRFRRQRRALASLALTTDTSLLTAAANDFGFETVFQRQIEALARPEDVLIAISTSGSSKNVLLACQAAMQRGLRVVALTGEEGGRLPQLLAPAIAVDTGILLQVPSRITDEIQQIHSLLLHILCELIEEGVVWEEGEPDFEPPS